MIGSHGFFYIFTGQNEEEQNVLYSIQQSNNLIINSLWRL